MLKFLGVLAAASLAQAFEDDTALLQNNVQLHGQEEQADASGPWDRLGQVGSFVKEQATRVGDHIPEFVDRMHENLPWKKAASEKQALREESRNQAASVISRSLVKAPKSLKSSKGKRPLVNEDERQFTSEYYSSVEEGHDHPTDRTSPSKCCTTNTVDCLACWKGVHPRSICADPLLSEAPGCDEVRKHDSASGLDVVPQYPSEEASDDVERVLRGDKTLTKAVGNLIKETVTGDGVSLDKMAEKAEVKRDVQEKKAVKKMEKIETKIQKKLTEQEKRLEAEKDLATYDKMVAEYNKEHPIVPNPNAVEESAFPIKTGAAKPFAKQLFKASQGQQRATHDVRKNTAVKESNGVAELSEGWQNAAADAEGNGEYETIYRNAYNQALKRFPSGNPNTKVKKVSAVKALARERAYGEMKRQLESMQTGQADGVAKQFAYQQVAKKEHDKWLNGQYEAQKQSVKESVQAGVEAQNRYLAASMA